MFYNGIPAFGGGDEIIGINIFSGTGITFCYGGSIPCRCIVKGIKRFDPFLFCDAPVESESTAEVVFALFRFNGTPAQPVAVP